MGFFLIVGCLVISPLSFVFHCVFPASFILLATGAASDPESTVLERLPGTWKRTAITACVTVLLTLSYLWIGIFGEVVIAPLAAVGLLASLVGVYRLGRKNRAVLLRMAAAVGFFHSFFIYAIYLNRLDIVGAVLWASLLPLAVVSLLLGLPSRDSGDGKEPCPESRPSGIARKARDIAEVLLGHGALIFPAVDIIRRWIKEIVPGRRR